MSGEGVPRQACGNATSFCASMGSERKAEQASGAAVALDG
jgi:hypothetical protein